jgi:hypothetical protein
MTTIVALAARDFIAVGADSLATMSAALVDPLQVSSTFFDQSGNLIVDAAGKPILSHASQIWGLASLRPVNQLPSITKVFSLDPHRAAVLFAGIARVGDVSTKNLVEQFKDSLPFKKGRSSSAEQLAEMLRDFVKNIYETEIANPELRPAMEILLAGYSANHRQPEIYRLLFGWDWSKKQFQAEVNPEVARGSYNVVFGGQYDVIQRVVNGIDVHSWLNLKTRCREVLEKYREKVQTDLANHGHPLTVISPDPNDPELDLFSKGFGGVTGIFADVSDLSEQAGIDFVRFLITTMIKAQEFSSSMPTVGGEIHLAVVTKSSGFQWVTKPYLERAGDTPHS